ncbi:MAG: hypothetical protein ABSF70_10355 [Terracidiphilus sp.]|jgi:hypothetical protein
MRKSLRSLLVAGFVFAFAIALDAGTIENQGKAWLDAQKDPPAINVSGVWDSELGDLALKQAEGSRDVEGNGGGYELTGAVSGKTLYLVFATKHGTVDYCGVVNSESDSVLSGKYYTRLSRLRFGAGLCQEKSRQLVMRKR